MLIKWHWRYNQEEGGIWKKVVEAKYGCDSQWYSNTVRSSYECGLWKGIMKLWDEFNTNTSFQVEKGNTYYSGKINRLSTMMDAYPR